MRLKILTGAAAAALAMTGAMTGCADSDTDETVSGDETAEAADPATEEMIDATDPLAGDPNAEGDDGMLGSDRVMQGSWTSKRMAGAPAALFGEAETEARFSVRCEGSELVFTRGAREPEGEIEMTLMAGGETRTITADSTPDPLPTITGRLSADDEFAATLAEISEPFAVRIGTRETTLRMPASAAFRDVVSNCPS